MFLPWLAATQLAWESQMVIGLRLAKLMAGGWDAHDEAQLMVREKLDAGIEAAGMVVTGRSAAAVVARYREHVAANSTRLLAGPV